MQSLDWQAIEQAVYDKAKGVIEGFAEEHPDKPCSFFACFADPFSGTFTFCFDTPENAAYEAMKQELMILRKRQAAYERLGRADAWRHARSSVNLPLRSYPHTCSFFQYASYAKLEFNWLESAARHVYPQREEGQDNYLEGQTRWMICHVMDRLVADRIFEHLTMTSPFRLGYEFHEEGLTVLRLLNWPAAGGNTMYSVFDSSLGKGEQKREWHAIGTEEYAHREGQKDVLARSDSSLVPSALFSSPIHIRAYPSALEEQPWSKDITITLDTEEMAADIQIMWPYARVDLHGLGRIEIYPTLIEISLKESVQSDPSLTLTLCDRNQQEFGILTLGSSLEQSASLFSEQTCILKVRRTSDLSQQSTTLTLQVKLHTFRVSFWLPSRNLWWLKNEKGKRLWQGNQLEYVDPRFFLEDLDLSKERFIAEAGVIGYEERRKELATILFALGRIAHAIEAYPQAVQFYGKSKQKFQSLRDRTATEKALLLLRETFLRQGKKEQAKHVLLELLNLRSSM